MPVGLARQEDAVHAPSQCPPLRRGVPRRRAGQGRIRISYYSSSSGFYIHGKDSEADYGTAHPKIFIGSENFSNTSLNDNRELGLIISSHAVMSAIASTFATDFRHGERWS